MFQETSINLGNLVLSLSRALDLADMQNFREEGQLDKDLVNILYEEG